MTALAVTPTRHAAARLALSGGATLLALMLLSAPVAAQQIDMDAIFTCEDQSTLAPEPCEAGLELVTDNCFACHAFVQIVLRQYDEGGWKSLLNRHRDRVEHLGDDEIETIQKYLAAKFNPDREPPELPPEIIEALTDY